MVGPYNVGHTAMAPNLLMDLIQLIPLPLLFSAGHASSRTSKHSAHLLYPDFWHCKFTYSIQTFSEIETLP